VRGGTVDLIENGQRLTALPAIRVMLNLPDELSGREAGTA
jgi:hypothetical protein